MVATAEQRPPHNRRRIALHAGLYVALLIVGVFVAWQVRVFVRGRRPVRRPRPLPSVLRYTGRRGQAGPNTSPTTAPAEMLFSPDELMTTFRPVETDPAGVAPPRGARRRCAWLMDLDPREERHTAGYDVPASAEAIVAHYHGALQERGFEALADVQRERRRTLVFTDGRRRATVTLRPKGGNAKMDVTVVVSASPADGRDRED